MLLLLTVRKFICHTCGCLRSIFTERLPDLVQSYARMTNRLRKWIEIIGRAAGGEMGTRLAEYLGICTSPTTILRQVMALPTPPAGAVSVLGIDDWSFRRSRKFGTILVDLDRHQVIDLLPDRCAETAAAWMQMHPEIDVVSRDRGEEYAAAARLGAPQARQVADRFHLAQNLTEIVEEILARCRAEIRNAAKGTNTSSEQQAGGDKEPTASFDTRSPVPDPLAGSAHLAHHAERSDRYQQLLDLRKEGLTSKEIARRLCMAERTIRRWITRGIPYERPGRGSEYQAQVDQTDDVWKSRLSFAPPTGSSRVVNAEHRTPQHVSPEDRVRRWQSALWNTVKKSHSGCSGHLLTPTQVPLVTRLQTHHKHLLVAYTWDSEYVAITIQKRNR